MLIAVLLFAPAREFSSWSIKDLIPFFDKWVHGLLFWMLAMLLFFGLFKQQKFSKRRLFTLLLSTVIALLYAGFTEWIQGSLHNGRTADPLDFAADSAGIIVGFFVCLLWKKSSGHPPEPGF